MRTNDSSSHVYEVKSGPVVFRRAAQAADLAFGVSQAGAETQPLVFSQLAVNRYPSRRAQRPTKADLDCRPGTSTCRRVRNAPVASRSIETSLKSRNCRVR